MSVEEQYSLTLWQASASEQELAWGNLDECDHGLITRYFENKVVPTPTLAKAYKYYAYPVTSLFDKPTWVLVNVDNADNITGTWLVNSDITECHCTGYLLNKSCSHLSIFNYFLKVLGQNSGGCWEIRANAEKGAVQFFTHEPFSLVSDQLSKKSTDTVKGQKTFDTWVAYLRGKYIEKNTPHHIEPSVFIRLCVLGKLNLLLEGSVGNLCKKVTDQQVLDFVNAHKGGTPTINPPATTGKTLGSLRGFLKYKKPSEELFYVPDDMWRQCLFCLFSTSNIMLTGPSGTGKTELAGFLGKQTGRQVACFNMGACSEPRMSLIGNTNYSPEKGTFFSESRFVKAITTPNTIVVLDELSRAPREAFNILFPVLDKRRELALDETGTSVKVAEGVCFLSTANVGTEYTGTGAIDRAMKDRFSQIEVDFPPKDKEIQVLINRTGIPLKFAGYLVAIANKQRLRARNDLEFAEQISTRMLLNAAEQYVFGIPFNEAIRYAICGMFSSDGNEASDRFKVDQIVSTEVLKKDLSSSTL